MNSVTPSPYPGPGEIVDAWIIDKILGEGGMGCVARAYHGQLQTPVAIKFMNPQYLSFPGARERFLNEGRASSRIKSDHVVPVSHAGETSNGIPYLVMECLHGKDLADLLAQEAPAGLPVARAVHFLVQILRALQTAHAVGIIHRDMKPSNCFVVNNDGEVDFVKILDFGISKVAQPGSASLTQTNSALGTPLYMSPEQARSPRDVDGRSDIYSVGVIFYELLTGHTPFFSESGEFTEILFKLFTAEPPPVKQTRPDLPDEIAAIVHKALARDVAERYQTPLELAEALEPYADPSAKSTIAKMRAFKPPLKDSLAPPEHLAPSMAAFSQMKKGQGTDVMADRPRIEIPKMPGGFTAHMPGAPGRVVATPPAFDARANALEAVARTQMDVSADDTSPAPRVEVKGAQTDLAASRDAAPMPSVATDGARKSNAVVFGVVGVALIAGLVGGGIVLSRNKSASANDHVHAAGSGASPDPDTSNISLPPPAAPTASVMVPAEPTASVSASASASASAAPKAVTAPAKHPGKRRMPGQDETIKE